MQALIIGGGVAANVHCRALTSIGVTIKAVCDKNIDAAKNLAFKFSANVFSDLATALKEDIDFAVICTPSGTHVPLAVEIMRAGKNVVVEKPLGLTAADCDLVLKTAKETNCICAPIAQLRFSDVYRKAKACLDSGELGVLIMSSLSMKYYREPSYYQGSWKGTKAMDGGELMNQGFHGIDLMCGLLGKPALVSGNVATRLHNIEAEDTAVALFRFPNGMIGTLDSSTAIQNSKPRRLEICGSKGSITIEGDRIICTDGLSLDREDAADEPVSSSPEKVGQELYCRIYENILKAMEGKEKLEYTLEDAAATAKLICAIYDSSEENKIVTWEE